MFFKIMPGLDNGYYVAGFTTLTMQGSTSGLLIKLDANGKEQWEKMYGDESNGIVFYGIAQLPNGNLMLTGSSTKNDPLGNVYTLLTDAQGNRINDEWCGGTNSYASSVAVQGNNGYLVAGISGAYGDSLGDIYYAETDNTISNVPALKLESPHIFPNPVTDRSSVVLPAPEAYSSVNMEVTDMMGKLIYSRRNIMAKDIILDKHILADGQYFFRILCNDGKEYKGKFVVD